MTPERRAPQAGRPPSSDRRPPAEPSPSPSSAPAAPEPSVSPADNPLADLIRTEIETSPDRRITFARFMERALYEPDLGYYRGAADRPTDAGDFLTAPETHPIFGWTVARRIEAVWIELGRPRPFDLMEYGAGSGTLALSICEGMRRHAAADLLESIRYEPVESNPHRLADLRRRFEEAGLGDRLAERSATSGAPATSSPAETAEPRAPVESVPVRGVILANEFLDALPVHRVVVRGGQLRELYVASGDEAGEAEGPGKVDGSGGRFVEVVAEPSTPALAERLADDGVSLAEGQVAEICLELEPWLRGVAGRLARGFVIAIDYGYEAAELYGPRRLAGTLLGYRGHRVEENPFIDPGQIDLTAHVDFTAVRRLAASHGLRTVSLTTQSEFLVAAGLEEELRALQASPGLTLADYTRARSGIVRMLDPRHMGRFRVLTLARGPQVK
ncbi:MAG: SAM-dependent methyltransferase [Candidatus Limnocylindrales bacterium]